MKLNNLLTAIAFALLAMITISCEKEDDKPYKDYEGYPGRWGYCSIVGGDGALYLTGSRGDDILVMKTNMNGELDWEKTYNLFGPSVASHGWTIEETFDHGLLISAYYWNDTYPWDTHYNGLLKLNASGDSLWSIILQASTPVALQAVVEASDHNIILVHEDEEAIQKDLPSITFSKISPDGMLIESKPYPEVQMPDVWIDSWQAAQDGSVMIALSRYDQAASIWTINSLLEVTSQESFQYGKEEAYFTASPGVFICADQPYDHSTVLYLNEAEPGNDPAWEQEYQMPCEGWAELHWVGQASGGYIVIGDLWEMGHSTYHPVNSYCMGLDAEGNQQWLWHDLISIYGKPCNFHPVSEDECLIIGGRDSDNQIVLVRLKNGDLLN